MTLTILLLGGLIVAATFGALFLLYAVLDHNDQDQA